MAGGAEKSCGGCSACCKVLRIEAPEFTKPAGEWCKHCRPGEAGGCIIYDARPMVCRDYRCAWLQLDALPPDYRPDRLKVMFSFEENPRADAAKRHLAVAHTLSGFEMYEKPAALDAIARLIAQGFEVHLSWGDSKTRVLPRRDALGRLRALDMPMDRGKAVRRKTLG
jgi:hypothetical protein